MRRLPGIREEMSSMHGSGNDDTTARKSGRQWYWKRAHIIRSTNQRKYEIVKMKIKGWALDVYGIRKLR